MLNYEDCIIVCFKITSDITVQYRIQHRILLLNIAWKRSSLLQIISTFKKKDIESI